MTDFFFPHAMSLNLSYHLTSAYRFFSSYLSFRQSLTHSAIDLPQPTKIDTEPVSVAPCKIRFVWVVVIAICAAFLLALESYGVFCEKGKIKCDEFLPIN